MRTILLVLFGCICFAQTSNTVTRAFPGAPSGTCSFLMVGLNLSNGDFYTCPAGSWVLVGSSGGGGVPSGSLILITSGSCASGYAEAMDLNGVTVIGTVAANMDVGTTGGSDTIVASGTNSIPAFTGASDTTSGVSAGTPSGTNSAPAFTGSVGTVPAETISYPANVPAFTGSSGTVPAETISGSTAAEASHTHSVTAAGTNASGAFAEGAISWPAGVPTFSGNNLASHTHTYTDVPNHVHVQNINSGTTGGLNGYGVDTSTNTSSATGYSTANPTGGVATGTTAGPSITLTPAGTIAWPAGVPTIAAGVFTQPTFTGSPVTSGAGSSHLHAVGTLANGTVSFTPAGTIAWPMNPPTNSTVSFTPAGTVAAPMFTGDALGTHTHTVTPTGTVSAPIFTGNSADNRSAFIKAIFCRKI